jgi:hypothetical protein
MEDRLGLLEKEFNKFDYMINPYHIQPGLLLDVDITSCKRKKVTLNGMANVLNEFLHGVSKGFQDAAFASFSRRRSTIRDDIAQSFADAGLEEGTAQTATTPAQAYLDMLNTDDSAVPALPAKASAKRVAAAKPKKAGRGKARGGKSRGSLRQI